MMKAKESREIDEAVNLLRKINKTVMHVYQMSKEIGENFSSVIYICFLR